MTVHLTGTLIGGLGDLSTLYVTVRLPNAISRISPAPQEWKVWRSGRFLDTAPKANLLSQVLRFMTGTLRNLSSLTC